ncbi:MAG: hypothetical protein F4117_04675 [Acidimicrobiales bacterium]|nr:SAM-dependent methyltransferase [Chloroflexota bacterium]MXV88580.1 hypothetical protein [Acidimicrobiales bacterium]MXX42588.1 hypothetical protein [Acidimicrobiales bacterium]MXY03574.1 hypothetical protein [Acidimicrobiales bacterium]MXZ14138.1 hypothetical protein [Acidimicrobiales bacterium]
MRFDEYMEDALYGASGFYVRGGRPAVRGGDFATAVELGSLFARCVAGYLDRVWHELGRPDPFVVVEGGAGRGTLCSQILRYAGECRLSLHYVMVERVDRQRTEALEQVEALGADVPVTAIADLPADPLVGVVLANELLDNLPFRLLERSTTGWQEVHVERGERSVGAPQAAQYGGTSEADEPQATSESVVEVLLDAPADAAAMADVLMPHAEPGARVPLQLKAAVWVRRALRLLERGRLLVFDYGVPTTAELAARSQGDWLRTYRSQRRVHDPLRDPGSADITCDVAFDQLPPGTTLTSQADWLAAAGIDDMTSPARNLWQRSRAKPSAKALVARTLLDQADALTDPNGMGAFWAAEWRAG